MTVRREDEVAAHEHTNPLDIDFEPELAPGEARRKGIVIMFILISVLLSGAAQLTLKYAVDRVGPGGIDPTQPGASLMRIASEPTIWLGLTLFGLSAAVWMIVLSRTSLSFAYPFAAMTYVLILAIDLFVLRVDVPPLRWLGVAFIMTGIVLVSRTRHHQ